MNGYQSEADIQESLFGDLDAWKDHWIGMPEFVQEKQRPYAMIEVYLAEEQMIRVRFTSQKDLQSFSVLVREPLTKLTRRLRQGSRQKFADLIGQPLTGKTQSIWYPKQSHVTGNHSSKVYVNERGVVTPRYPVYIVSKGRWESRLTSRALEAMRCPYHIVIEHQEYDEYARVIQEDKLLILPQEFLDSYDTCDDLGATRSKGPGAARNFCWQHSLERGFPWHWVMDDNLDAFHWFNRNTKHEIETAATLCAAEDFVDRYENIGQAGLNYYSFCKTTDAVPPYTLNTRIYSCILQRNDIPFIWRGRYNEDTDLSLRILKSGLCTLLFNAFLCGKVTTQRMSGGNTKEFYENEGTLNKSEMLVQLHPDVSRLVQRFHRWHHHVDYSPFKRIALKRRPDAVIPEGINNYGMVLKTR
jgi:hypothetical protein